MRAEGFPVLEINLHVSSSACRNGPAVPYQYSSRITGDAETIAMDFDH